MLNVPVVPVVAITGEGINDVISSLRNARSHSHRHNDKQRWSRVGKIIKETQKIRSKRHTIFEAMEDLTILSDGTSQSAGHLERSGLTLVSCSAPPRHEQKTGVR